jgi:hypothetical protein
MPVDASEDEAARSTPFAGGGFAEAAVKVLRPIDRGADKAGFHNPIVWGT